MEPTFCYAYLNARIMPELRGEAFEDPLADAMGERGIGEVTGGGTLQEESGEIVHCGIDLELSPTDENLHFVRDFLTRRGAPKGSKLQFERNGVSEEIPFGEVEGIGVYINGTDLPAEVYQTSDINEVIRTFMELTQDIGVLGGHWEGPTETAIYMYAPSAVELMSRIAPFMAAYPLCQKARVVRVA